MTEIILLVYTSQQVFFLCKNAGKDTAIFWFWFSKHETPGVCCTRHSCGNHYAVMQHKNLRNFKKLNR